MEWIVIEREFPEALTDDDVHRLYDDAQCVDLYRVQGVRSYLSPDRRRMVCVVRAPDAESVRTFLRVNRSVPGIVHTCSLHTP